MKNEASIDNNNNSKHVINNSSMITAENSSKNSKFHVRKNNQTISHKDKYSNTALFENPYRNSNNKKQKTGVYLTDVTISKFKETEFETKTTLETTNSNYKTHKNFLNNRNKTPRVTNKNSLPHINRQLTRYHYNPPTFSCCDQKIYPKFLAHLYKEQFHHRDIHYHTVGNLKQGKKKGREDKNAFLRKTNEIKRIKYEIDLKKEAMEEYKENFRMQKRGIELTISNLKSYKDIFKEV